jgi:predicted Zn-dependent peptidase
MALKGTKKRPTPFAVASVIDGIGGEYNAGTSKDFTEYWVKVAAKHVETAFDFLADNLKNPIFPKEAIEKERQVIIEEINMYKDLPMRRVSDIFDTLVYGNTSLGRDIAGDEKTVAKIKRKDFFAHLENFYGPKNLVVVVAGKFSLAQVKKLMGNYFGDLKKGKRVKKQKIDFKQIKPQLKLAYKKTDQAHFILGVPGVNYTHSDRFVVALIASILGYSRTSRIYRRIREERGWAYYVQTAPEYYVDTGALFTRAGVTLAKVEDAIELVKAEYQAIAKKKVSHKELKKAKEYLKGRFILSLEDSFHIAARYGLQAVVERKIRTPEQVLTLIDKVTEDDILRVSKRLFKPEKLNLALIGPYKGKKRFEKILGI